MRMSFFDNTLNRERAKEIIKNSDLPILYTYGLSYRHPTTYRIPINKQTAFSIINNESLLDVEIEKDYIHLNAYSDNDMW